MCIRDRNVTVVPSGPLGYLTVWPTGLPLTSATTLNATDGMVTSNAAIVAGGSNGSINVYASNLTDVIIDINGYFAPPSGSGLQFSPVTPCRVVDTRASSGMSGAFGTPALAAK